MPQLNERQIVEYEQNALTSIGSNKDMLQFLAKRQFVSNKETMNRSIILNFSEDGKHGCRFSCSFCSWKDREEVRQDLTPTPENIREFLKDFEGYKVTISGGGDPLYHFDTKNRAKLFEIINTINEMGFLVDVITKEFSVILQHHEELNAKVNCWSFSEEVKNPKLLQALGVVNFARISKIYQGQDYRQLCEYIDYYKDHCERIYFRENFFDPSYHRPEVQDTISRIKAKYGRQIVFLCNNVCSNNFFLVKDEVRINETPVMSLV